MKTQIIISTMTWSLQSSCWRSRLGNSLERWDFIGRESSTLLNGLMLLVMNGLVNTGVRLLSLELGMWLSGRVGGILQAKTLAYRPFWRRHFLSLFPGDCSFCTGNNKLASTNSMVDLIPSLFSMDFCPSAMLHDKGPHLCASVG